MKKILLIIGLIMVCLNTTAQKSYIYVRASAYYNTEFNIRLSGNLPSDMTNSYTHHELADILNKLSENGYILEYCFGEGTINFLFSKESSNPASAVSKISVDDGVVSEIARYNLQGVPVNEKEKGIQIIVYSNYTTKTLIVQ